MNDPTRRDILRSIAILPFSAAVTGATRVSDRFSDLCTAIDDHQRELGKILTKMACSDTIVEDFAPHTAQRVGCSTRSSR